MKLKGIIITLLVTLCIVGISSYTQASAEDYPANANVGSYGTTKSALKVREGRGTNFIKIGLIPKGTLVYIDGEITKTNDGNVWCYCSEYGGYIAINWLEDIYYAPAAPGDFDDLYDANGYPIYGANLGSYGTTKSALKVRKGPGTNYPKIGLIFKETEISLFGDITYTSDGNVWCYCTTYDGYVAINWVKDFHWEPMSPGNDGGDPPEVTGIETLVEYVYRYTGDSKYQICDSSIDYYLKEDLSVDDFVEFMTLCHNPNVVPKDVFEKIVSEPLWFNMLEQRALDVVKARLVDSGTHYWTVNGKACNGNTFKKNHGCSNCDLKRILNWWENGEPSHCDWYSKLFPEFNVYGCSMVAWSNSKGNTNSGGGKSCFGFGNWCNWYSYSLVLGEQNFGKKGSRPKYASGKLTADFFSKNNIRPGDVIRRNGSHTMVVYSWDSTGVMVLDANNGNSSTAKGNGIVKYHSLSFDGSSIVIARPKSIVKDN